VHICNAHTYGGEYVHSLFIVENVLLQLAQFSIDWQFDYLQANPESIRLQLYRTVVIWNMTLASHLVRVSQVSNGFRMYSTDHTCWQSPILARFYSKSLHVSFIFLFDRCIHIWMNGNSQERCQTGKYVGPTLLVVLDSWVFTSVFTFLPNENERKKERNQCY
jgi:hypothetical protein